MAGPDIETSEAAYEAFNDAVLGTMRRLIAERGAACRWHESLGAELNCAPE